MINRSYFMDPSMVHGLKYARGDNWLNVGCGTRTPLGFFNTDLFDGPLVDQVVNLMDLPLPWDDHHWDFILASHVLEHIPHYVFNQEGDPLVNLVNELIRVMVPGGILEVHTPMGPLATYVIDHCRKVNDLTFRGWFPDYITTSNMAKDIQRSQPKLELVKKFIKRDFKIGPIEVWHTRHYLGLEVGSIHQEILVYRVIK